MGAAKNKQFLKCVQAGVIQEVEEWLKRGMSPDFYIGLDSPLSVAISRKTLKMVEVLLKYVKNINLCSIAGHTPLMRTATMSGGKGDLFLFKQMLNVDEVDIHFKNNRGESALTLAFGCKNISIFRRLLKKGACVNDIFDYYKADDILNLCKNEPKFFTLFEQYAHSLSTENYPKWKAIRLKQMFI